MAKPAITRVSCCMAASFRIPTPRRRFRSFQIPALEHTVEIDRIYLDGLGADLHPAAILFRNRSGAPYREDTLTDDFASVRAEFSSSRFSASSLRGRPGLDDPGIPVRETHQYRQRAPGAERIISTKETLLGTITT